MGDIDEAEGTEVNTVIYFLPPSHGDNASLAPLPKLLLSFVFLQPRMILVKGVYKTVLPV